MISKTNASVQYGSLLFGQVAPHCGCMRQVKSLKFCHLVLTVRFGRIGGVLPAPQDEVLFPAFLTEKKGCTQYGVEN